jgi:hypothetical protein
MLASAGVKSKKCKKPATGKDMAGAPIFEAMLRLVAVFSIEEEEAVVATAAANKGVVSAVGMVVVVLDFRNGIFWEDRHLVFGSPTKPGTAPLVTRD